MSPTKHTLAGEEIGMMVVDPGQRSGAGWGDFTLEGESSYDMVRKGLTRTIDVMYQNEVEMAEHLAQVWLDLRFHWTVERSIPNNHQFLVIEDFILDIRRFTMERNMLSPVRVRSLIEGMLFEDDPQIVLQMPALAKQVTNDQLRRHGLWVPGKERRGDHQLDVRRHMIQVVRRLLKGDDIVQT